MEGVNQSIDPFIPFPFPTPRPTLGPSIPASSLLSEAMGRRGGRVGPRISFFFIVPGRHFGQFHTPPPICFMGHKLSLGGLTLP